MFQEVKIKNESDLKTTSEGYSTIIRRFRMATFWYQVDIYVSTTLKKSINIKTKIMV